MFQLANIESFTEEQTAQNMQTSAYTWKWRFSFLSQGTKGHSEHLIATKPDCFLHAGQFGSWLLGSPLLLPPLLRLSSRDSKS